MLILMSLWHVPMLHAHGQLGLQITPVGATSSRVTTAPGTPENTSSISAGPYSSHFKAGAIYDYSFLRDNYYVSTGVFYLAQKFVIKKADQQESYNLHYLQVPVLLKLYTDDIALDVRIYGKLGPSFQFNLGRLLDSQDPNAMIQSFKYFGIDIVFGIGGEYEAGLSTSFFAGLSYAFGLSNKINTCKQSEDLKGLRGMSDLLSIELGARF